MGLTGSATPHREHAVTKRLFRAALLGGVASIPASKLKAVSERSFNAPPRLHAAAAANPGASLAPASGRLRLRVVASWLAGANHMRWRRFLLRNAPGGIPWASTVGVAAYQLGRSASGSLGAIGLVGLALAALVHLAGRVHGRRRERSASRKPTRKKREVDPGEA